MVDLLEAHSELAKKYAHTIDKASFVFIDNMIKLIRELGEAPEDYELVMVSKHMEFDTLTTEWTMSVRKKVANPRIVD